MTERVNQARKALHKLMHEHCTNFDKGAVIAAAERGLYTLYADYEAILSERDALKAQNRDLLETLQFYRDQMCEGFCLDLKKQDEYDESMDFHCAGCKARAAIAKARGKA